jgi:hypothetical protein
MNTGSSLSGRMDCRWPVFLESTYELCKMHHNRPLEFKPGISAMFLLARLAWIIFPHARTFLQAGGLKARPDARMNIRRYS